MIRICILIGFFIFSVSSYAALFGTKTYEECVSDGKVGRTNAEIQLLINSCQIKFPHLKRVNEGSVAHIVCVGKGVDSLELKFNKSQVLSGEKFKDISPIRLRHNNTVYFNLNKMIKFKEKFLLTSNELNTLDGRLGMEIRETEQGKVLDKFHLVCYEK